MEPNARLEQLWELVQSIPVGKVCGYGDLGQALQNPVSGLLIGRWMSVAPDGVPWWRVVAADGRLPIWKKDPNLETFQHDQLAEEGVEFELDGRVRMDQYRWFPDDEPTISK